MRSKLDRLKDNAWKTFSKYIRLRDKKCYTCPKGLAENAGHFWHNVLDFDEENIHGQCVHCNKWLSGNLAVYSVNLLREIGKKRFEALDIRHTRAIGEGKHDEEYYQNIINTYKNKIKELPVDKVLDEINY